MNFALAAYSIVAMLLFYVAISTNFRSPPPRNVRFSLRWLFWALTVTAGVFGFVAAIS